MWLGSPRAVNDLARHACRPNNWTRKIWVIFPFKLCQKPPIFLTVHSQIQFPELLEHGSWISNAWGWHFLAAFFSAVSVLVLTVCLLVVYKDSYPNCHLKLPFSIWTIRITWTIVGRVCKNSWKSKYSLSQRCWHFYDVINFPIEHNSSPVRESHLVVV